jgi:hypothetical protein
MAAPTIHDVTTDKPPPPKRWIPLSLRFYIVINGAVGLIGVVSLWYVFLRPVQRHGQAYDRISNSVRSLAHRRPVDVSRNQWSYVIGWTMNGIGNCCSVDEYLNPNEQSRERFRTLPDRFEERLRGDVSLETVDWLWDELEIISKYGAHYSDSYRPTTTERLAEADATPVGNAGPIVD